MRRLLADYWVFLGEFRRNFHSTGAVLPSGRSLGRALSRYVREDTRSLAARPADLSGRDGARDGAAGPPREGRRILEVGPGTGAVTAWIIRAMLPDDRLDLVELNDRFVERLRHRLEHDPLFRPVAERTRVLHQPVEQLAGEGDYDLVVSGLPLNNFASDEVERLLATMMGLLRPEGVLSFFEYVGVRPLRCLVAGRKERARLRGVGQAIAQVRQHEVHRDLVWPNVPPAWVHHCACRPRRAGL